MPLLALSELSVAGRQGSSETHILDDISLSLRAGEILGIVGESGAGKTMISMALLGMLPAGLRWTNGEYTFAGTSYSAENMDGLAAVRGRQIAMIFQNAHVAFNPLLRIGRQISDVVRRHLKLTKMEARGHVLGLLADVALDDPLRVFSAYPHQLSGGMAQRCMIAMALSCQPLLVIADEPTSALDATIRVRILKLLHRMQRKKKFGLLLISHDLHMIRGMADRMLVLHQGRIVESGVTEDVFNNPQHDYTRRLLEDDLWADLPLLMLSEAAERSEGEREWTTGSQF